MTVLKGTAVTAEYIAGSGRLKPSNPALIEIAYRSQIQWETNRWALLVEQQEPLQDRLDPRVVRAQVPGAGIILAGLL